MKTKTIILSTTLAMLFATVTSYGHGSTQLKKRCSFGWQRKATAQVNNGPIVGRQVGISCPSTTVTAFKENNCAWQRSTLNYSTPTYEGQVFRTPYLCGRGFPNADMFYEMMKYKTPAAYDAIAEQASIRGSSIDFLTNQININYITGFMEADSDMQTFFQIQIWNPQHNMVTMVEDTTIDASEIVWSGKVTIKSNEMTLEGGFTNQLLTQSMNGTKKRVSFMGKTFNIVLPNSVDINNVIVVMTCDGGYNQQKSFTEATETTDNAIVKGDIQFDVFPNPSSEEFNIKFKSNKDGKTEFKIYSISGQLIQTLYNNEAKKDEEISIRVDTKSMNLPKGMYFIYIDNATEIYLKKIIIE